MLRADFSHALDFAPQLYSFHQEVLTYLSSYEHANKYNIKTRSKMRRLNCFSKTLSNSGLS